MKFVYKGRILKDEDTLESYGVEEDHTIHLVRARAPPAPAPAPSPAPGAFGGLRGGLPPGAANLLSHMDPRMMETLLGANPETAALLAANPELRNALRDPDMLRQAMAPDAARNLDRAMANIEAMPGGFQALARMHATVAEPLERGMMDALGGGARAEGGGGPAPAADVPLPNPWAARGAATGACV